MDMILLFGGVFVAMFIFVNVVWIRLSEEKQRAEEH